MRVLIYADMRSPHAQAWVGGLESSGFDVFAISSVAVEPAGDQTSRSRSRIMDFSRLVGPAGQDRIRTIEGITRYPARRARLRAVLDSFEPDLLHCLRLPYEGVTGLSAVSDEVPVVVSSWGQDFVRQAANDVVLRSWMRRSLPHASAYIADTVGDVGLARAMGLPGDVPTTVLPANFGVLPQRFHGRILDPPTVTYIRGLRSHVNHRAFLDAAAALSRAGSSARFVGIGLEADHYARRLSDDPVVGRSLRLTGHLTEDKFNKELQAAAITVSPASSDGMPISVLRSLAYGCITVVSSLPQFEQVRSECPGLIFAPNTSAEAFLPLLRDQIGRVLASGMDVMPGPTVPSAYSSVHVAGEVKSLYTKVVR